MSASDVVAIRSERDWRPFAWGVAAAGIGLVAPWLIDRSFASVSWMDIPDSYFIWWAVISVLTVFLGVGCAIVLALKGPVSGDPVLNSMLALMTLSITAFLVANSIPHLAANIQDASGAMAGPSLDRGGLIQAMGVLGLGLSLAGMLMWRLTSRPVARPRRSATALVVVLLVTLASAYLALSKYMEVKARD